MEVAKFSKSEARVLFEKCCGSGEWINQMMLSIPFVSKNEIMEASEKIWNSLNEKDWLEAFSHHPKIGDINSLKEKFSRTKKIAEDEQSGVSEASDETLQELSKLNEEYERKFGYIFIICASGKSADEMLMIIKERIKNDSEKEIKIAAGEQNKITKLRLEKLL